MKQLWGDLGAEGQLFQAELQFPHFPEEQLSLTSFLHLLLFLMHCHVGSGCFFSNILAWELLGISK